MTCITTPSYLPTYQPTYLRTYIHRYILLHIHRYLRESTSLLMILRMIKEAKDWGLWKTSAIVAVKPGRGGSIHKKYRRTFKTLKREKKTGIIIRPLLLACPAYHFQELQGQTLWNSYTSIHPSIRPSTDIFHYLSIHLSLPLYIDRSGIYTNQSIIHVHLSIYMHPSLPAYIERWRIYVHQSIHPSRASNGLHRSWRNPQCATKNDINSTPMYIISGYTPQVFDFTIQTLGIYIQSIHACPPPSLRTSSALSHSFSVK